MQKQKPAKFIKKFGTKSIKSYSGACLKLTIPQTFKNQNVSSYFSKREKTISQQYFQIDKRQLKNFIVIGMVKKQIFCIYHPFLNIYGSVDQHAMHERVRYQYYINILKNQYYKQQFIHKNIQKSNNKFKIQILSKQKYHKLLHITKNTTNLPMYHTISKLGLQIVINQNNQVYLTKYNKIFDKTFQDNIYKQICLQLLQIQQNKSNKIPKTLDNIIAEYSCKNAIKFGDDINIQWCIDLLYNASLCIFPWKCVHGRQSVHFHVCQEKQMRQYSLQ